MASAGAAVGASQPSPGSATRPKTLVAHRGASAYAPEHTLAAYALALEQGADFVEQDLAVTKDGVLVCIHDLTLERTTNVEDIFPNRSTEDRSGPAPAKRWLVHDFTVAELKQLDAGWWFNPKFAGTKIPTFQEAVDLLKGKSGMYPELKDPEFYRGRGVKPEDLLAAMLKKNGLISDAKTPVIIQSFDADTVKALAKTLPQVPRVFLVGPESRSAVDTQDKVRAIATWATGLGPNRVLVEQIPALVTWAHAAKMTVTPWTFRERDPAKYPALRAEMARFLYTLGVDALFTDNPDQFPRK
jgi:glycerophosphoryl diester phosphodiesterase